MKNRHWILALGLIVISAGGGSCNNSPTSVTPFNLTGTVNYQGGGSGYVYVFLVNEFSGNTTMSAALNSGSSYSFTGVPTYSELFAAYDNSGNGFKLVSSTNGNTLEQGNGASLSGSGDVVCLVGYTGVCPNVNFKSAQGTYYSTNTGLNIVFGGALNQSGTNCSY